MQCQTCGNQGMVHHGQNCDTWPRCNGCGDACRADASDTAGSWKPIRLELGYCDICAIWEERARSYEKKPGASLIIAHHMYSPDRSNTVPLGQPDPFPGARYRGMGGRRFDFQRFGSEEAFSCFSLWSGGEIPQRFWSRMPDNARFLHGAEAVNLGDVSCFNASR